MSTYNSSEELQRQHSISVFKEREARENPNLGEKDAMLKMLDKYIKAHGNTVKVRSIAAEKNRDNGYQLDLSADITIILEEIRTKINKM